MLDDNPFLLEEEESNDFEASLFASSPEAMAPQATVTGASVDVETQERTSEETELDWSGDGLLDGDSWEADWAADEGRLTPGSGSAAVDGDDSFLGGGGQVEESLVEHLEAQALGLRLNAVDRAAVTFLIGSLDDGGFLTEPLELLADSLFGGTVGGDDQRGDDELAAAVASLRVAHALVRTMSPTGVGAVDTLDCLSLQLFARVRTGVTSQACAQDAQAALKCSMEWVAKRDTKKLASALRIPELRLVAALVEILKLDPRPAANFHAPENRAIVPDVVVRKTRQGYRAEINSVVMPKLRVDSVYAGMLRSQRVDKESSLQHSLQEARWFVKNIQQRFDTILRVSAAIVERQSRFFAHGAVAMRPLVLREIADELGLHESTISRVTSSKFMATPQGTFELKYFFGSSLETAAGGSTSSTAVKALIRQFVLAEHVDDPLSDTAIADMLKSSGVVCARRTVAKYREALRIPVAGLRKK